MARPEAAGIIRPARGHAMKLASILPVLAVLGLAGCATGYGYSDDGYYYGRSPASVGSYGSFGYGSPGGWRYGYGLGYGSPGYYGYYDPYTGYYYDPYFGYYFPRPPVVIIQRPDDGHGHGHGHDHDHDDHDGDQPPPWHDLDNVGNRSPYPVRAPDGSDDGARPRLLPPPLAGDAASPPSGVHMSDPTPPRPGAVVPPPPPPRARMSDPTPPRPSAVPPPSRSRMDGNAPSPPSRVRMPEPTPPRPVRVDPPRPSAAAAAPSMPRMGDDAPLHKGDRRR